MPDMLGVTVTAGVGYCTNISGTSYLPRILTLNTLCPDCDHITTMHSGVSSTAPGITADVKPARSWLSSVKKVKAFLWESSNFGVYNPNASYYMYPMALKL